MYQLFSLSLAFCEPNTGQTKAKERQNEGQTKVKAGNGRSRVGQGGPRAGQGLTMGALSVGHEQAKCRLRRVKCGPSAGWAGHGRVKCGPQEGQVLAKCGPRAGKR
jgi:hypothetical protein